MVLAPPARCCAAPFLTTSLAVVVVVVVVVASLIALAGRLLAHSVHDMSSDELTLAVMAHLQTLQDVSDVGRRLGTCVLQQGLKRACPPVRRTQPMQEIVLSNWKSRPSA